MTVRAPFAYLGGKTTLAGPLKPLVPYHGRKGQLAARGSGGGRGARTGVSLTSENALLSIVRMWRDLAGRRARLRRA